VDVVHDDEELAGIRDDIQDGDDVRVADSRDLASFLHEDGGKLGGSRQRRVQLLDRNDPRKADGPDQLAQKHPCRTCSGQLIVERVASHRADRGAAHDPKC